MSQTAKVWLVNIVLCTIVSGSYCMYGFAFRKLSPIPPLDSIASVTSFGFRVTTQPYFIAGLVMALLGSVLRIVLMKWLDVSRAALASEINLIFTLIFAWYFLNGTLRFPRDFIGAGLILLGSIVVSQES